MRKTALVLICAGFLFFGFVTKVGAATPPLTDLVARYVAGTGLTSDGGDPNRISLWADQSGNGYDLSQVTSIKQPYNTNDLSGNPIVRFPYDYPTHPQVSMANAVIQLNTQSSSIFVIRSTYHSALETLISYTSWASILKSNVTDTVGFPYMQLVGRNFTSIHPPLNKTLVGGVLGPSGYIGYSINASSTQSSIASTNITGITVGSNLAGTSELFSGDIYEILIYNAAVSQATVDAIRSYAVAQYGVQSSFTKQVVMVGDSNTEGSEINNGENYPRLAYPSDWHALNNGIGGTHLSNGWLGQARATTTDLLYDSSLGRNVMVVMLGTNDINTGSKSAAQTFANLNTFVGDRQAAGWEVWVMPILPLIGPNETIRDTYNVLLTNSANYTNVPDRIVDYLSDSRISDSLTSTDYGLGDNVHLNGNGAAVLAQYVYKELNGGVGKVSYSISGNLSGQPNEEVTLTLTPSGGTFLGEVITPSDGGAGGTFTPSTIITTIGGTSTTTTYTRPTEGTSSITFTNNGVMNNPVTFNFTASIPTYTIGGTTSGLSGTVIIQNNSGDNETISSNGLFTFDTPLNDSSSYAVTILTQPTNQTCTVSNGSGTVSSANVTNITVSCTTNSTPGSTPTSIGNGSPVGLMGAQTTNTQSNTSTGTLLAQLQKQIEELTVQLQDKLNQSEANNTTYTFSRNLSRGMTGTDVLNLQKLLNTLGFTISTTGPGSPNRETTLFGLLTYKALQKFQKSVGLPATGFFGPMTRNYLNNR